MIPCSRFLSLGAMLLALCTSVFAENPKAGLNRVIIRAQRQDIYFYPAERSGGHHKILFAPGDRGCRGFAVTITEELAKAGHDVYCVDTRRYLESFTRPTVLRTAEIASDFNQMARWIEQGWARSSGADANRLKTIHLPETCGMKVFTVLYSKRTMRRIRSLSLDSKKASVV